MLRPASTFALTLLSALAWLLAHPALGSAQLVGRGKPAVARPVTTLDSVLAQAKTASDSRDFVTAYRLLSQAYLAQPHPLLLHGLAMLAAAEEKTVEAQDLWRRFLADPSLDGRAPERAVAQSRLLSLPLVTVGEVSVGAPRGAVVEVDGRLVGVAPLPAALLVHSGRHRVAVTLGRWRAETELSVRTARLSELRFKEGADVVVATLPAAVLYVDAYQGQTPAASAGSGGNELTGSPLLDALLDPLTQAAAAALKRENYVLLPRRLALAYEKDLPACQGSDATSDACVKTLSARYGAEHILRVAVSREDQAVRIEVALHDVQVDDLAATASATCPGCSSEQAATKLAETITQVLTTGSGRSRGTLAAVSDPLGGEVRIGNRLLGVTPLSRKLWAGSYEVTISRAGHRPYVQQIEVKNEETTQLEAALVPGSAATAEPSDVAVPQQPGKARSRGKLIMLAAGGAAVAVGAVLLGFGASALAQNGSCAVTGLADPTLCRRFYDTAVPGATLSAIGSALLIGGGVALILPLVKKSK